MMQIPQQIRNQIARMPEIRFESIRKLLELTDEELEQQQLDQKERLLKAGHSDRTAVAYLNLAPILMENNAIQTFLIKTGSLDLRQSLPDLESAEETASLAVKEYQLSPDEVKDLKAMLGRITAA